MFYKEAMSRVSRVIENSEFRTVRLQKDGRTFDVRVSEQKIDEIMREAGVNPVEAQIYPTRVSRNEFAHVAAVDRLSRTADVDPPDVVEIIQEDDGFAKQFRERHKDSRSNMSIFNEQCDLNAIHEGNKVPPPPDPRRGDEIIRSFRR